MIGWYPDHHSFLNFLLLIVNPGMPIPFQNDIETTLNLMSMFFHFLSGFQTVQTYQNALILE